MHFNNIAIVLTSLSPLVARADLQLDSDDISATCTSICRPVLELSLICDVDDDIVDDRNEDLLTLQCLCTNNSFDVNNIAGLCASCMQQNPTPEDDDDGVDDDDDLRDINEIMTRCGFSPRTFDASQANAANGIVVAATRPNAVDQLTTTVGAGGGGAVPTTSSVSTVTGTVTSTGSTTLTTDGSTLTTGTTATTLTTGTTTGTSPADTTVTVNAAPGLEALGGGAKMLTAYLAGVFMLGDWVF